MSVLFGGAPRPTTRQINSFPRVSKGITPISGDGATIPIIYGRDSVPGFKIAEVVYGGDLYVAQLWCLGPIHAVEKIYINDAEMPSGVSVRHYLGNVNQGVDSWLAAAIPGYADTLVYSLPGGEAPAAYSVFKITTGALSGAPRFRAIIQGKLITDPDAAANSDPYYNNNAIAVDFEAGGTDSSQYAHTINLSGDASITSGGLQLTGVEGVSPTSGPAYASVAANSAFNIAASEFCLELVFTATNAASSPEVTETILTNTTTTSPGTNSFRLDMSGSSLLLYLSSDGVTWDIANGANVGTITASETKFTLERIGDEFVVMINGTETWSLYDTSSVFVDTASPLNQTWYLGQFDSSQYFVGSIQAWRLCIGNYRYGSSHVATATPFADSGSYGTQQVYSTNPALAWGDMASSTLYGAGATLDGLSEAAAWCDELLDTGTTRCSIGFTITSPQRVESWLDLLATYANCVWFPEGANLRIQPDRASSSDNPSGVNIVANGTFDTEGSPNEWTKGTGWSISAGVASCDGTQVSASSLTQTLTTEDGIGYAISYQLATNTGSPEGSITVEFAGTEVIAAQTAAGTYTALVTASGTSNDIEIIADADFIGTVDNVTVRRSHWLETKFIQGSLEIGGPSERGSPTSVKVKYTVPSDTDGNWQTASAVRTLPDASDGTIPFIQTTLDLPGVQTEDEALNKAVQKLQRMYKRLEVSYLTRDHGIIHRVGDTVQVENTGRGASVSVWVESVTMQSHGIWRVEGILYDLLHFPNGTDLSLASGTTLFAEPTEHQYVFNIDGMFGCDQVSQKIMLSEQGFGHVQVTLDGGLTWEEKDVPGTVSLDNYILLFRHDPAADDFWMVQKNLSGHRAQRYTENDGDTWGTGLTDNTQPKSYDMIINNSGDIYVFYISSGVGVVDKYESPKLDNPRDDRITFSTSNGFTYRMHHVGGNIIGTFTTDAQTPDYVYIVNDSLSSGTSYQSPEPIFNGIIGANNGTIAVTLHSVSGSFVSTQVMTASGPDFPITTFDFGEPVSAPFISYGNGRFLLSVRRNANPTQLLVVSSVAGSIWAGKVVVQLDGTQDETTSRRQVSYFGNSNWLIAYRQKLPPPDDSLYFLRLEKFRLLW